MSFDKGVNHTPKKCRGCVYREKSPISVCACSCRTGKLRGCPVEECTRYEKEKRKK